MDLSADKILFAVVDTLLKLHLLVILTSNLIVKMSYSQRAKANNLQEAKSGPNVSTPETSNAVFVPPKSTGKPIRVPGRKKKAIRVSKQKRVNKTYPLRDLETIHRPGEHPSYKQMIDEAIFNLDSRKGVSRAAIKNYIAKKYPVGDRNGAVSNFSGFSDFSKSAHF